MAQVIAVISDLIAKRRAGTATLADYLNALKVVISYLDSQFESERPVIGSEDVGKLLAVVEEFAVETTGQSIAAQANPTEGGSALWVIVALLKLLAAAA